MRFCVGLGSGEWGAEWGRRGNWEKNDGLENVDRPIIIRKRKGRGEKERGKEGVFSDNRKGKGERVGEGCFSVF